MVATGDNWDFDPARSVERIARHGRGGYCFHLNGALSELLATLGYEVTRHVGGVHAPDGPAAHVMANHLVLPCLACPPRSTRAGLGTSMSGSGDALYGPLPLIGDAYRQPPWQLCLDRGAAKPVGDWHLSRDPSGGFPEWRGGRRPPLWTRLKPNITPCLATPNRGL